MSLPKFSPPHSGLLEKSDGYASELGAQIPFDVGQHYGFGTLRRLVGSNIHGHTRRERSAFSKSTVTRQRGAEGKMVLAAFAETLQHYDYAG
jgi:hypothetical protein